MLAVSKAAVGVAAAAVLVVEVELFSTKQVLVCGVLRGDALR